MARLGIYQAQGGGGVFFDAPPHVAWRQVVQASLDLAPGVALVAPAPDAIARCIGEVVVQPVVDATVYKVLARGAAHEAPAAKGQPIAWDVQTVNKMIVAEGLRVVNHYDELVTKDDGQEEEERYVLSLVLEPNNGQDGAPLKPDTQKDIYSAAEIRKGAHNWLENGGKIDLMHNWQPFSSGDVRPCESYLAPVTFTCGEGERARRVLKGSWMLALRILNDRIWKAIKERKLGAYSIGGAADRTPVDDTGTGG